MKLNLYAHDNGPKEGFEEFLYGKKREPIASRLLRHFGYCCAGAYLGFLITEDLPLAILSLGLAWSSVGVRRYILKCK